MQSIELKVVKPVIFKSLANCTEHAPSRVQKMICRRLVSRRSSIRPLLSNNVGRLRPGVRVANAQRCITTREDDEHLQTRWRRKLSGLTVDQKLYVSDFCSFALLRGDCR